LHHRSVNVESEGEETMTIITDYRDYKEVNGIVLPHTITISGAAPFPLVSKIDSYQINATIDPKVFIIE
jgi:hypothetical protein